MIRVFRAMNTFTVGMAAFLLHLDTGPALVMDVVIIVIAASGLIFYDPSSRRDSADSIY